MTDEKLQRAIQLKEWFECLYDANVKLDEYKEDEPIDFEKLRPIINQLRDLQNSIRNEYAKI